MNEASVKGALYVISGVKEKNIKLLDSVVFTLRFEATETLEELDRFAESDRPRVRDRAEYKLTLAAALDELFKAL